MVVVLEVVVGSTISCGALFVADFFLLIFIAVQVVDFFFIYIEFLVTKFFSFENRKKKQNVRAQGCYSFWDFEKYKKSFFQIKIFDLK